MPSERTGPNSYGGLRGDGRGCATAQAEPVETSRAGVLEQTPGPPALLVLVQGAHRVPSRRPLGTATNPEWREPRPGGPFHDQHPSSRRPERRSDRTLPEHVRGDDHRGREGAGVSVADCGRCAASAGASSTGTPPGWPGRIAARGPSGAARSRSRSALALLGMYDIAVELFKVAVAAWIAAASAQQPRGWRPRDLRHVREPLDVWSYRSCRVQESKAANRNRGRTGSRGARFRFYWQRLTRQRGASSAVVSPADAERM